MTPARVLNVVLLTENGGRVDWAPNGTSIAFDRVGDDGFYDVWTMAADGTGARNLTGDHDRLGLPVGHKGNPAWHPGGEWLVIQVEQAEHFGTVGAPATSPGAGIFNDLWLLRSDGSDARPLVTGAQGGPSGALHPHFSDDGSRLVFASYQAHPTIIAPGEPATLSRDQLAKRIEDSVTTMFGSWALASVDLGDGIFEGVTPGAGALPVPHAVRVADRSCFVETHAVLPDGTVLLSGNTGPFQAVTGLDILTVDPASGEVVRRVTDAPDEWDEHAHPAPSGSGRIVFTSSRDLRPDARYPYAPGAGPMSAGMPPRADLWVAEPDGSRSRLTWFNEPAWEHRLPAAEHVFVSDNAFSPAGDEIVAAIHLLEKPPFVTRTVIAVITLDRPL